MPVHVQTCPDGLGDRRGMILRDVITVWDISERNKVVAV